MPTPAPRPSESIDASAAPGPPSTAAIPTVRKQRATARTKLNASISVRSGFFTAPPGSLENVDGDVDHDPHHVDEVPVDPRKLDAEMRVRLRPIMPADGANQSVEQQVQADEDMGAVQAREAVERRAERQIVRTEPEPCVLASLDEEEGEA